MSKWNKDSWRDYNILQQPVYPDTSKLRECEDKLSKLPPLVFAGEVRNLKDELRSLKAMAFYFKVEIVLKALLTLMR